MTQIDEGPEGFFRAMSSAFAATIRARRLQGDFVGVLCAQAFDCFRGNLDIQSEGAPPTVCKGECDACCCIRVVATAPEIFLLVRFINVNAQAFIDRGVDLKRRIVEADAQTAGLSEKERLARRRICPFVEEALCVPYKLRPLACRGHASYDREACEKIAAGEDVEARVSTPHMVVRSLVQGALMSALSDAGLPFGLYELNHALAIALSRPDAEADWIAGGDPLSGAAIPDFSAREAVAAFEAIKRGGASFAP